MEALLAPQASAVSQLCPAHRNPYLQTLHTTSVHPERVGSPDPQCKPSASPLLLFSQGHPRPPMAIYPRRSQECCSPLKRKR